MKMFWHRIRRMVRRTIVDFARLYSPYRSATYLTERWAQAVMGDTITMPVSTQKNLMEKTVPYWIYPVSILYLFTLFLVTPIKTQLMALFLVDALVLMDFPASTYWEMMMASGSLWMLFYYFNTKLAGSRTAIIMVRVLQGERDPIVFEDQKGEGKMVRERVALAYRALKVLFLTTVDMLFPVYYLVYALEYHQLAVVNQIPLIHQAWQMAIQIVLAFLWSLAFALFVDVGALFASVCYGFFLIVQLRVRKCNDSLKRLVSSRLAMMRMGRVRLMNIRTLLFCLHFNGIYGHLLLIILVGHLPSNGTLLMTLLTGHHALELKVGFIVLALGQYTVIFLFHFIAAQVSKLLHSPYKRMMSVNLTVKQMHPVLRSKLANHVQAMSTKNRAYGITYASFGLISYSTMLKFLLMYGEVLMYNYTTIRYKK